MSKKDKFSAKNARRIKELERQAQAREKKLLASVDENELERLGITDVEQGTLEISEDTQTVKYTGPDGKVEERKIEDLEKIIPGTDDWEAYIASGGDPNIPKGSLPVKLKTKINTHKIPSNTDEAGIASQNPSVVPTYNISQENIPSKESIKIQKMASKTRLNEYVNSSRDQMYQEAHDYRKESHWSNPAQLGGPSKSPNGIIEELIDLIHPDNRSVEDAEFFATDKSWAFNIAGEDAQELAQALIRKAGQLDPQNKILAFKSRSVTSKILATPVLAMVYPSIDNKEYDLAFATLTDKNTRRIKFNEAKFPVWEGHSTHPTRNEGFITKAPFENLVLLFENKVQLPIVQGLNVEPVKDSAREDVEIDFSRRLKPEITAITFSSDIQHLLVQHPDEKITGTTVRTILPKNDDSWKVLPPQGTAEEHDGYSSIRNDAITLGYLHWFGRVVDVKTGETISNINRGAYFDINTGAIWVPVQSKNSQLTKEPNQLITYLVPAGSKVQQVGKITTENDEERMDIDEDIAFRVADIFMFIMNYLTSPRMQTEEVQAERGERRRAKKAGLPPPPPWTVISYKPPSNIKQNSVSTGTGSKHSYMYDVRGHWKNQPCGPRHQQRRLIWIHPHFSGLSNETYVPRNRLVQEKEEYED